MSVVKHHFRLKGTHRGALLSISRDIDPVMALDTNVDMQFSAHDTCLE